MEKTNIKICHVATVDITVRFILWDLLKFFKKESYDVSIICSPGKWTTFLKEGGFFVHNIKMSRRISPIADLISLIKLYLFFRREKFDIVHTHTPKAGVLGRIAARMAGVPVVIHTSHGFYIGEKIIWRQRILMLLAEKISSLFCDLVFSINSEDIDWAIKKGIVGAQKIKLLGFGVDITRFDNSKFGKDFVSSRKKDLGIENKKVIGMVGRFVKEKGYLDLFKAFKAVKRRIPNAVLLLIAPRDQEKQDALDISVVKDYGIENDVIFLGYEKEVSNMEDIYPLMDVFVLPSYREGFPYSIMEASASGLPIVATDIRGCREALENGKTGKLVPLADPDKLSEALVYFLQNIEKAREMGRAGRIKAERDFDERLVFDRIKEEYSRLIKEKLA